MIYLKKGQTLFDNQSLVVYDQTGYYNDGDSIICAPAGIPEEPVCRYEAKFIAYGGIVYSISDPDKLLEEVMKLDPKSLFGKESNQIALDKMINEIVPQDTSSNPATDTATTTPPTTTPIDQQTATSTPDFTLPPVDQASTPPLTTDTGTSTSTPPIIDIGTSTSTPAVGSGTEASSTTPAVSPTPTPTPTPEITPIPTPTPTPSPSPSPSPTPEISPSPIATPEVAPSPTPTATGTTTDAVVSYAKKKIIKKIFNV